MATISQRIESLPMTRTTWVILMLVGVGWMFDAMDQGMVSGVIAAIGTDWDLSKYQLSWLTSSGIFGMMIIPDKDAKAVHHALFVDSEGWSSCSFFLFR